MAKVIIRRQPRDYRLDEVSEACISRAHWTNICGGLQVREPIISVYGYMDYHVLKETEVAVSGSHDWGHNYGKICMNKNDNLGKGNEEYEPAYCRFIVQADYSMYSLPHDHKKTRKVSELLKEHPLTRRELMAQLENKGIKANAIREAINILIKAGYLNIEGPLRGQNSILSLVGDFPYSE